MARLTPQELDEYLAGAHVAHFASTRRNGRPHVSPVWYQWESNSKPVNGSSSGDTYGTITVVSGDTAVKTRNVRRNPKVAISVATDEWPYQYVILEGDAIVTTDNIRNTVRDIFSRYEGPERGEEDADELTRGSQKLVAIVINVTRIISFKDDAE